MRRMLLFTLHTAEMPISVDLRSGDFFWTSTPPPNWIRQCNPPDNFFFDLDLQPHPPPPQSNFAGKTWIYLSGISIGWILIQPDSHLDKSNKEETLLFLFAMNNVHHSRKLSHAETVIQAQEAQADHIRILEHMELKSLSFLWATDPNFRLSRSFGHPHGRAGDWLCIRKTRHL